MKQADGSSRLSCMTQARHLPAAFWAVLALALLVRLPGITRPLLGNFATKNCVYAMIARNWGEGRAGWLYPTLDVLRGGHRSLHLLEFPCSAYLTAGLWRLFGGSLDVWGRATAVAFSVASVALLFLFVRRRHGRPAATAAALAMALAPVAVIYGQSFMLEPSLVFFTLAGFTAAERWHANRRTRWLVALGLAAALLLLTKVYMLVVLVPLAVMFRRRVPRLACPAVQGAPRSTAGQASSGPLLPRAGGYILIAVLALSILPTALWCIHVQRTASPASPLADRVFYSLGEGAGAQLGGFALLRSPDFYRNVLDDLTGVVLTPAGFALALAGLCHRRWRQYALWLLAMGLLLLALPRKFDEMNYYYLAVLPPLCIMVGLGWDVVYRRVRPSRTATGVLLLVALVLSLRYAARPAFVTPAEDRAVVDAAGQVQRLTTADEPVATMHGTTIDLLYYCDRPGWALSPAATDLEQALADCRRQGARYLVVIGEGPTLPETVARGDGFRIFRLPDK